MSTVDHQLGVPALGTGDCQVWWANSRDAGEHLVDLLDSAERERWARFRVPRAAAGYLVAHAVARLVLGGLIGIPAGSVEFTVQCVHCGGPHGKPQPRSPAEPLELSISHSGDLVAVAFARGVPVGVDVEEIALRGDEPPRIALAEPERAVLAALPQAERTAAFIRYWTRKEALLKATGDGLTVSPARLTVSAPDQAPELRDWPGRRDPRPLYLTDIPAPPGYLASLASLGSRLRAVEHDATALLAA
jgi:4'-phosphopantetheinyl transferase